MYGRYGGDKFSLFLLVIALVTFQRTRFKERNTYKYFRCPQCKQKLRAPRGRGKIQVTCQKCHHVFQTKT